MLELSILKKLTLLKQFEEDNKLTVKELEKVFKRAVISAGSIIKKLTLTELRSPDTLPAAFHKSSKYSDRLVDAVRVSFVKNRKNDETEAKVHILGSRKAGSGTYRLRFFENYPTERYGRGGRYYGKLPALRFFERAVNMKRNEAVLTMRLIITLTIDRINEMRSNNKKI